MKADVGPAEPFRAHLPRPKPLDVEPSFSLPPNQIAARRRTEERRRQTGGCLLLATHRDVVEKSRKYERKSKRQEYEERNED